MAPLLDSWPGHEPARSLIESLPMEPHVAQKYIDIDGRKASR